MTDERPVFGTLGFYEAMAKVLADDETWAEKGGKVKASMVYHYEPPVAKWFYVNFDHGAITDVLELNDADERPADFVISGSPEAWKAVLQREVKPATAMATGKLKVKGKQTYLLKNMGAFSRILDVMASLDPTYD